jgi:hypothetical protein
LTLRGLNGTEQCQGIYIYKTKLETFGFTHYAAQMACGIYKLELSSRNPD